MSFPVEVANNDNLESPLPDQGVIGPQFTRWFATAVATRYYPLADVVNNKIRMYKSTDTGATWSEKDSAHALTLQADATGAIAGFPNSSQIYSLFTACQGGGKIWVTTFNSSHQLFVIPFDPATDTWGTAITSTFGYLNYSNHAFSVGNLVSEYRTSDDSVWVALPAGTVTNNVADSNQKVWGAKCLVLGAGWDANLVLFYGTANDALGYAIAGLREDSGHKLRFFLSEFNSPSSVVSIHHGVIHTDNSIAIQTNVVHLTFAANAKSLRFMTDVHINSGVIKMGYQINVAAGNTNEIHTLRGLVSDGDAPTWENFRVSAAEALETVNNVQSIGDIVGVDGTGDFFWFSYTPDGDASRKYAYCTSSGIGNAWSGSTLLGSVTQGPTFFSGFPVAAESFPAFSTSWSISFAYGDGGVAGVGYWEIGPATPHGFVSMGPFLVGPGTLTSVG